MGFLDDLLSGFSIGDDGSGSKLLRRNVKSGEALLEAGDRATARIVGLRVRPGATDSPDQQEFALELPGGERLGCRQVLGVMLRSVRLGMEIPLRVSDGRAIIDLPELGPPEDAAWGYKPLGDPPPAGIDDYRFDLDKERRRSREARATVLAADPYVFMGMPTQNVSLQLRVELEGEPPYEETKPREDVPFYASHLAEPGTVLGVLVRDGKSDKVRIDWPSAAVAEPGVGRPAAAVFGVELEPDDVVGSAGPQDWTPAGLTADEGAGDRIAGVEFDTWVAVEAGLVRDRVRPNDYEAYAEEHGVPAGAWDAAQNGWQSRMMRDPRVGARFGAAYQDALERR